MFQKSDFPKIPKFAININLSRVSKFFLRNYSPEFFH